jgi:hypothetical protein
MRRREEKKNSGELLCQFELHQESFIGVIVQAQMSGVVTIKVIWSLG